MTPLLVKSLNASFELFRKGGIAAPYRNDKRQEEVNARAVNKGASDGTAQYYGVPGSASGWYTSLTSNVFMTDFFKSENSICMCSRKERS